MFPVDSPNDVILVKGGGKLKRMKSLVKHNYINGLDSYEHKKIFLLQTASSCGDKFYICSLTRWTNKTVLKSKLSASFAT